VHSIKHFPRTPVQAVGLQLLFGSSGGSGFWVLAKLKVKQRRESKLSLKVNKRGVGAEFHLSFQGSQPESVEKRLKLTISA